MLILDCYFALTFRVQSNRSPKIELRAEKCHPLHRLGVRNTVLTAPARGA